MGQRRLTSLIESVINVVVGFFVALFTQILVFPFFGLVVGTSQNLLIALIFTVVSVVRSFALRRLFNWMGERYGF